MENNENGKDFTFPTSDFDDIANKWDNGTMFDDIGDFNLPSPVHLPYDDFFDPLQSPINPHLDLDFFQSPTAPNFLFNSSEHQFHPPVKQETNSTQPMLVRPPMHRRTPSTPSKIPVRQFKQFHAEPLPAEQISITTKNQRLRSQPMFQANHERNASLPTQFYVDPNIPDDDFLSICQDQDIKFNPVQLGFIPSTFWPDHDFTFGELVANFFQRKNNANSRFSHKLYNALKIADFDPFYADFTGIEWVNDRVLKVDKRVFARLLGIKTIDGSLFHQQGNFPSHGFVELGSRDALQYVTQEDLEDVDFEKVRLLIHPAGVFVRGCTEQAILHCKWTSCRKANH